MVSTRRRAVQRDKAYCAGDKIEVVRTDGIDVGILLRKEEDEDASDSSVTHWLVSVEGGENEEEWISEKSLGRVLQANDSSDDNSGIMSNSSKSSSGTMAAKKSKNGGNNKKSNMKVPTKKSTSIKHSKPTTTAATAAAAATATNANNKNKNNKNQKGKSSKSGRSRRITTRSAAANNKNENGKSADLIEGLDNIDTLISKKVPSHRPKPKKEKDDETVVEVKMLTGTLFIYRGRRRRVEFIRTS